jgi:hypothetical protein
MDIIHEQLRMGIYCSSDWVTEGHQGTGKGDDAPKMADSELKAMQMLSAMIKDSEIQVVGRESVCCLLVLNLVSSTLPCIRRPRP